MINVATPQSLPALNSDPDWSKSLKQLFIELIECNSVMNTEPAEAYFYAFMGAYLNKVKIADGISNKDLRVNITWIQTSRTGKGRVNKALMRIAKECGVSCQMVTSYTEAGLIGTINEEAVKHNDKYAADGLSEANPSIVVKDRNGNDKTILWRDPIVRGDAGNYDIVIFDEMQILLEPKKDNQEILLILQPAMDCPPFVRKKLRSAHAIEYSNPVTFIGTTYPFGAISSIIATSGFLQRTNMIIRKLTLDEIKQMKEEQKKLLDPNLSARFDAKLKIFTKKLEKIGRGKRILSVDVAARDEIRKVSHYFIDMIKDTKGSTREALLSFANTVEEVCLKIAGQSVVIYGNSTIKSQDIKKTFEITKVFMEHLTNKIDVKADRETEDELKRVLEIFKRTCQMRKIDHLSKKDFREALNKAMNKGLMACGTIIDNYAEAGYFIVRKGEKNLKNYYLNTE